MHMRGRYTTDRQETPEVQPGLGGHEGELLQGVTAAEQALRQRVWL